MATHVVKFGGSTFTRAALAPFARAVHARRQAGHRVVVVHGGGKEITRLLDRLGIPARFLHGLRVTDDETLRATEQVLSGHVNKALARALAAHGVPAVGIAGTDAGLLQAEVLRTERVDAAGQVTVEDYGHVGRVVRVDPGAVQALLGSGYVPVVSPLASGGPLGVLNVNADAAAAALAGALGADEFLLLTDVPGVLVPEAGTPRLVPQLAAADVERLKNDGTIRDGMIPKVDACVAALAASAAAARIQHLDDFLAARADAGTRVQPG